MYSTRAEEHRLLYLLGKFRSELARDCMGKARESCNCKLAPYPLDPIWIKANSSGNIIAYRFHLKNPSYFMLSHPISRFRRAEDYFIGGAEARYCAKLGLIPVYIANLNKFTLLRAWGSLTEKLFSNVADPIPEDEKVHWRLCPRPRSNNFPQISSANFVLRQSADFNEYNGKYRKALEDYFRFGFWSFSDSGFSSSTIILNDSETIHTVLRATKSVYIPLETYYKSMDLGREKDVQTKVLSLLGLMKGPSGYELRYQDGVVLSRDISKPLEDERKKGQVFINGIVTDFLRQSIEFPTLTAVELYGVSNYELMMSIIGLVVDDKFNHNEPVAIIGSMDDVKKEVMNLFGLLLKKSYLDTTIADAIPDQFSLAIDYLYPILTIDQGSVLYLHPSVFVSLIENGLGDIIEKKGALIATLRLLDKMWQSPKEVAKATNEIDFLRKNGHFPERVFITLQKAIEELHLARLLKNPLYKTSTIDMPLKNISNEVIQEKIIKPKMHSTEFEIEDEKEQNFFDQVSKLNRRVRELERDSQ